MPVSLHAKERALRHLVRLAQSSSGGSLYEDIQRRHCSHYGRHCNTLIEALGSTPAVQRSPADSPWSEHPFTVYDDIPGFHGKSQHSSLVSRALTEDVLASRHASFKIIFTDGSVNLINDSASAAYHIPSEHHSWSGRLDHAVSSTTAELCGIHAALLYILKRPPENWLLATDSQCAVRSIRSGRGVNANMTREIFNLGRLLVFRGCNIRVQWIPSHVGILGNEKADQLASNALLLPTATLQLPTQTDSKIAIQTWIQHRHPVSRIAAHDPPPPACTRGLTRKFASLLHRLRSDSAYTNVNLYRIGKAASPNCQHCDQQETIEHIFFKCEHYASERIEFLNCLRGLDIPFTLEATLFPKGPTSTCIRLRKFVFCFLGACELLSRL